MADAGAPDAAARHHSRHLRVRVREEAQAAVRAAGLDATLAHLALATAYAKRLRDQKTTAAASVATPAP